MFNIEIYAGDTFSYTTNVSLSNTMTWTANAMLTTLDLLDVYDANNNIIGILVANLTSITSNLPNTINYTLTLSATPNATVQWIANSVNPNERVLYVFMKYTSNTGFISHGNTAIIRVKAAEI
jgi:hypothetical protein